MDLTTNYSGHDVQQQAVQVFLMYVYVCVRVNVYSCVVFVCNSVCMCMYVCIALNVM